MKFDLSYWGKSGGRPAGDGWALAFSPNLARPKVFFDQQLKHPLRFREAMSALHEVVVGDFRFKRKDKSSYEAWKAEQAKQAQAIRKVHYDAALQAEVERTAKRAVPKDLEGRFHAAHQKYWTARRQWATELQRSDPELFRALVPCDPVVTVAPDTVFFECFAKDESSYGCLYVDRDAFVGSDKAGLGTTNVDYSLALYEHFQTLRTYRPTRLQVDPAGFEVNVQGQDGHREEKIDLPSSWLRGFGQLQGAMSLATRKVELSVDVVYSLLAYLQRHREKAGPRSLKFQLTPGKPAAVVLEPWGHTLVSRGAPYQGPKVEDVKVWGRRRLAVLARLLPLAEKVDVLLVGSGLPSAWVVHLGEMKFVLAMSGWTQNDWTSGASLELLAGDLSPDTATKQTLCTILSDSRSASLGKLAERVTVSRNVLVGSLFSLAQEGQVMFDHAHHLYRWRPALPVALSQAVIGPEPDEVAAGKKLAAARLVKLGRQTQVDLTRTLHQAKVDGTDVEALLDVDGGFSQARCQCHHFRRFRLRAGPCRHLLALRLTLNQAVYEATAQDKSWWQWLQ